MEQFRKVENYFVARQWFYRVRGTLKSHATHEFADALAGNGAKRPLKVEF
jgi:hypothetical protein